MSRRLTATIVVGLLLIGAQIEPAMAQSPSAEIRIGSNSGNPSDTNVGVPVMLSSFDGAQVSILGFDLTFDDSQLAYAGIQTGSAAEAAGKDASANLIPPDTIRILVSGGVGIIGNGTVAIVLFDVDPDATGGTTDLAGSNSSVADPTPAPIDHTVVDGSFTVVPLPTDTPVPSDTPIPPTPTNSSTPGPSATPSRTPTPSNTSPPTATRTPGPSPTASSTPGRTSTTTPTGSATATRNPTATRTPTSEGAGEGLELEGAAAATGTALSELEGAVAATSTALAEEAAARPTDQIVGIRSGSRFFRGSELLIAAGLFALAIGFAAGASYLVWRRRKL